MSQSIFKHNPNTLNFYHPLEHAYLSAYLGVDCPEMARNFDPYDPGECDPLLDSDEYQNDGIFRLRPSC